MAELFQRSKYNPILKPAGEWWKIYNPGAALDEAGQVHLFPRVMKKEADWHSRIAHAVSEDGEHFTWKEKLVFERRGPHELRGLEDPRVTKIGETFYMAFAVYDGTSVQLHTASAPNLDGPWQRHGPAVPDFDFVASGGRMFRWEKGKPVEKWETKKDRRWSKSGAFFPEKINGRFTIVFGEYGMWLAHSDDAVHFHAEPEPLIRPRRGTQYFDNTFIETGPPPILTERGWLVLYHGIDDTFRYQLGCLILDRQHLRKILYRSDTPIFGPREAYEVGDSLVDILPGGIDALCRLNDAELKAMYRKARQEHIMPQVTFCPGAVIRGSRLWLYYGAGDTSICTASADLDDILKLAA